MARDKDALARELLRALLLAANIGRAAEATVASVRGVASDLPLRDLFHLAELLPAPPRTAGRP